MKPWPFIAAITMLAGTVMTMQGLSHGENNLVKKPFSEFPLTIKNRWVGQELGLAEDVLEKLQVSDYMMRVYVPANDLNQDEEAVQNGHVSLYVGFYQSQRTGATYHSPKNCLPGAGWQIAESKTVPISLADGSVITINKVMIQKGLERQIILYWYHDRGRIIASEYWAKAWMVWDAMSINRTDGALVRISVPVVTDSEQAFRQGVGFLKDMWDDLLTHMPDARSARVS